MAAAFAMIIPFFIWGNPSGHDFEFHLNSWMEVLSQWKQGILFPAWAGLSHFGYGEARFIFYPPLSWTLGAALGAILPWRAVPGAYIFVALTLSGCSMFLLARRWIAARDALFAAILYLANPYYIVIVYWRSAMAELLAGALLPLLLLVILRSLGRDSSNQTQTNAQFILPIALIVAAAWLTNIPSAVMVTYSLGLLLVLAAIFQRRPRILLNGGLAILLAIGLASFYLLPVFHEQKWISIAQVLSPGVRPQDNFLFTLTGDADHNRFNWIISAVAVSEMIVLLAAAAFLNWQKRNNALDTLPHHAFRIVTVWVTCASVLTLPFTLFVWNHFPELQYVQFPWRWLLCVDVALALLVSMAWQRWILRLGLLVGMLCVLLLVSNRFQPPWWDTAGDIAEMLDNQVTDQGYEGTDEYVPAPADPSEIKQDAPLVSVEGDSHPQVHLQQWTAQSKSFSISTNSPQQITLRLFNYPAWKTEVNGRQVSTETQEGTGQLQIPIQAGENQIRITFATTKDRILGRIISGLSLLVAAAIFAIRKRKT